eukprot:c4793_g1_i1.p1 GENE.c4793_g1_i1~~c4793_g1_i1.p1  ORF type:complete len:180 (+),score=44.18 c4793_g1_i1:30-542(+)
MELKYFPAASAHIHDLKLFNAAMFPVKYSEKFYETVLLLPNFTSLAFQEQELVGAICCRTEVTPEKDVQLYIMTLGVKPFCRRRGVASEMLRRVVTHEDLQGVASKIYLHVQISNEQAIEFYRSLGFQVETQINNYYQRIDPPHCFVLSRPLEGLAESIAIRQSQPRHAS